MRCYDNGAFYTVTVLAREVADFARSWPCSGLRDRSVTFTFDKRLGNLVDSNDAWQHPGADGGALVALSQDAMRYGAERLKVRGMLAKWGKWGEA